MYYYDAYDFSSEGTMTQLAFFFPPVLGYTREAVVYIYMLAFVSAVWKENGSFHHSLDMRIFTPATGDLRGRAHASGLGWKC